MVLWLLDAEQFALANASFPAGEAVLGALGWNSNLAFESQFLNPNSKLSLNRYSKIALNPHSKVAFNGIAVGRLAGRHSYASLALGSPVYAESMS